MEICELKDRDYVGLKNNEPENIAMKTSLLKLRVVESLTVHLPLYEVREDELSEPLRGTGTWDSFYFILESLSETPWLPALHRIKLHFEHICPDVRCRCDDDALANQLWRMAQLFDDITSLLVALLEQPRRADCNVVFELQRMPGMHPDQRKYLLDHLADRLDYVADIGRLYLREGGRESLRVLADWEREREPYDPSVGPLGGVSTDEDDDDESDRDESESEEGDGGEDEMEVVGGTEDEQNGMEVDSD